MKNTVQRRGAGLRQKKKERKKKDQKKKNGKKKNRKKASTEKASEEKRAGIAELPETDKLIVLLKEHLSRIQKESGMFEINEDYIYASELGDDEDYKKRIDAVRNKLYYEPNEKYIIFYRENYVDIRFKEYHLLKGYLGK